MPPKSSRETLQRRTQFNIFGYLFRDKCPCCFGPVEGKSKISPDKPDVMICGDGNFQQRHYSCASKDLPAKEYNPPSFLLPSEITKPDDLCKQTAAQVKGFKVCRILLSLSSWSINSLNHLTSAFHIHIQLHTLTLTRQLSSLEP